jgi:hypothetical protein
MTVLATSQATEAVRDAAAGLDLDLLTEELSVALMQDVFAGRSADRAFADLVHRSTHGNLANIQGVLCGRLRVDETRATPGALQLAATAAELRLPEAQLERAYRAGQNRFWAAWFRAARDHSHAHGEDLEGYLDRPSELLFSYIGHVLQAVGAEYRTVADVPRPGHDLLRETVLDRIATTGDDVPADEIERVLGYPAGAHHAYVAVRLGAAQRPDELVARLRRVVAPAAVLVRREGAGEWGLWLASPDAPGPAAAGLLRRVLTADGARAAGAPGGPGLAGMRLARERALRVARVQRALDEPPRVLDDADVRNETLLLDDPARAAGFVAQELGPLASADERGARLRGTLLTWLATGSHVATAATLGVHEHTVRNRLREIEGVLGVPVAGRRAELLVALRLHRVHPGAEAPTHQGMCSG